MVICQYFQRGQCKFGDRCRYEHPGHLGSNRFGALSGGGAGRQTQQPANYAVTASDVKFDLTPGKGRPEWVFSAYGPGRNAPRQLFGGPPREQSFEELRLQHYEAAAAGNPGQALQTARDLFAQSVQQMDVALSDPDGAVRYVVSGENEHPNRIDIVEGRTGPPQGPSPFGQPSAFGGQTSTFGGGQSAFGKPSFGQPSFGQPPFGQSSFGQPSFGRPAFGQPSFGQPSAPGFGQPSTLGQTSTFGKPSGLGGQPAFGKPAFGQSSFGQPSFEQTSFGQPSSLGGTAFGKPTTASPFTQLGAQSQPQANPFGQPSNASPFNQQAGQPQQGGFGQRHPSSGFGRSTPQTTGFSQPTPQQTPSAFSQPPAPKPSPFGTPQQQPSAFGQPAAPTTGFGQQQQQQQQQQRPQTGPPPFLKIDDPNALNPIPPLTGQTFKDPMTKKLTSWKGQPVKYINDAPCYLHPQDGKTFVHIFFPDGPPEDATQRDAQGKSEEYTAEITERYEFFLKNGFFKDGVIPSVPPKKEWMSFDF